MNSTLNKTNGYGNYSLASALSGGITSRVSNEDILETSMSAADEAPFIPQMDQSTTPSMTDCEFTATTTFVDEVAPIRSDYCAPVVGDSYSIQYQEIKDFLSRPLLISTLTWSTASAANTLLDSNRISTNLFSSTFWTNKMQGFALVRGTAVLRIQMNANPFQQGKLLLHFLPCADDFNDVDASFVPMHNANLATKTQQPSVIVDCRDSIGELSIPYISPRFYYEIKDDKYDWGSWYISVLSPLQTGAAGETALEVTTYLHFEDFELAAPTVPQSGGPKSKTKFKSRSISRATADAEGDSLISGGPISRGLRLTSKAANSFGEVPMLSTIVKPVGWAAGVAASIAEFFGWSKPQSSTVPAVMSKQLNKFGNNSDGVDMSYHLALRSDNKVKMTSDLSIRDVDEMSLDFLKRIPAMVQSVDWPVSSVSGTSLASILTTPFGLGTTGTTVKGGHTVTWITGPPINYFAPSFQRWRGTIRLKIQIVKTDFHTGRLQITFTPRINAATAPTLATGIVALREIVDLRSSNEIVLDLPWLIANAYSSTNSASGRLDIVVLNELRAPETASSSVQLLLWWSGGDDFEFANPGSNSGSNGVEVFSPQMMTTTGQDTIVNETVGGITNTPFSTNVAELCIGEIFTSFKQILNRQSTLYAVVAPASVGNQTLSIWPWLCGVNYLLVGGTMAGANAGGDPFGYIAPCFAFYRGGVRLSVMTTSANNATILGGRHNAIVASNGVGIFTAGTTGVLDSVGTNLGNSYPVAWFNPIAGSQITGARGSVMVDSNNGFGSFLLPYYAPTRCSLMVMQSSSNTIPNEPSQGGSLLVLNGTQSFTATDMVIHRSFPDDFQLTYFISTVPRFVSYV